MIKESRHTKNTACEVELTEYAIQDLELLPDEVLDEVEIYLEKLQDNIYLGQPLYDRKDSKLKGCRKLFIADRTYRIVYQVKMGNVYVLEIDNAPEEIKNVARVVAIGLREDKEVYKNAHDRIALDKESDSNKE